MNYFKKIKEHWLISTIVLCGVIFGTTWMLSGKPVGESRNFEIEKSTKENTILENVNIDSQSTSIVKTEANRDNEEKSLMEGTSFTSKFGFIVYISNSDDDLKLTTMYITLENKKNKYHKNVGIGGKILINHANNDYSIDVNNIRGDWVDLIIRKDS